MAVVDTLYGAIDSHLFERLKQIRLLVCDIDGVFSDGRIYLGNDGEELKAFHTRDGYGIKALVGQGIEVAVITGRKSAIVQNRMTALNVSHIIQGREDKASAMEKLCAERGMKPEQVAAVGDDMPDLGMFKHAGTAIAVSDAHPHVRHQANWITTLPGGYGAVREICDTLLQARGALYDIHGASI